MKEDRMQRLMHTITCVIDFLDDMLYLMFSTNSRAMDNYFTAKSKVRAESFAQLQDTARRNLKRIESGKSDQLLTVMAPANEATRRLVEAIGYVDLTVKYQSRCVNVRDQIGEQIAQQQLKKEGPALRKAITEARAFGIPVENYLGKYTWSEIYL